MDYNDMERMHISALDDVVADMGLSWTLLALARCVEDRQDRMDDKDYKFVCRRDAELIRECYNEVRKCLDGRVRP